MKLNSLQLGKAMSAALFVLLMVVAGMKNALAQNQVATLQHGDSISGVYYGSNALVSAHTAAVDGDIITLSSGNFNSCNIEKAIIVRGAGCVYDSITNVQPTIISGGGFSPGCDSISMEGLLITSTIIACANTCSFSKCCINRIISCHEAWPRSDYQFFECIIKDFKCRNFPGMSIINSVVRMTDYYQGNTYNLISMYNSVILFNDGLNICNLTANNSIISTVSGHTITNCTFNNCVGLETGETSLFEGQTVSNCMEVNNYEDVFETFTGEVIYDNIYQLKEEVATTFLGSDGTEVGIYGGMMPYNPRPTYMVIKRCNVAPRSTVDGKLSVDIEVLTEGE